MNANLPYFHVIIRLPDKNIQYGRVVAELNKGKMAERSKALGLGPSIFGCVGSNPILVNYILLNNFGKVFTKLSILYKKSPKVFLVETVLCSLHVGRNFCGILLQKCLLNKKYLPTPDAIRDIKRYAQS